MTDANWQQSEKFGAVLNIPQVITTMAYYEERYVALYCHIVKLLTYKNLTSDDISIIDQD